MAAKHGTIYVGDVVRFDSRHYGKGFIGTVVSINAPCAGIDYETISCYSTEKTSATIIEAHRVELLRHPDAKGRQANLDAAEAHQRAHYLQYPAWQKNFAADPDLKLFGTDVQAHITF